VLVTRKAKGVVKVGTFKTERMMEGMRRFG
jgi:hypothetical protein